jgi:hypothetical protein
MNITRDDLIALSGLDEAEIAAISDHEQLPESIAAALGQYLLHQEQGPARIRAMIRDDIRAAIASGERERAATLIAAFRRFVEEYDGKASAPG